MKEKDSNKATRMMAIALTGVAMMDEFKTKYGDWMGVQREWTALPETEKTTEKLTELKKKYNIIVELADDMTPKITDEMYDFLLHIYNVKYNKATKN
jgi:hypothetical protein